MGKIYKGDIGVIITVDTGVDITSATERTLKIKMPDGTFKDFAGTLVDTTKIKHITIADDLDQDGRYKIQPFVDMPTFVGLGNTDDFFVERPFQ